MVHIIRHDRGAAGSVNSQPLLGYMIETNQPFYFRVVAFDHLGFGFSDKPSTNYTYSLGINQLYIIYRYQPIIKIPEVSTNYTYSIGINQIHILLISTNYTYSLGRNQLYVFYRHQPIIQIL